MNELKNWLLSNGFIIHPFIDSWIGAKKLDPNIRKCEDNDDKELLLVVHPYEREGYQKHAVEISGCTNGKWFKLECYGLRNADVMNDLTDIERRLIAAWEAVK